MKLLIGTPTYDGVVTTPYFQSILRLMKRFAAERPGVELVVETTECTLVAWARNALATRVLQDASYTHLLFVDSDMGFSPSLVGKMLDFDEPFVGCICPKRVNDYERLLNAGRIISDTLEARMVAQKYAGGDDDLLMNEAGGFVGRGDFLRAKKAGAALLLLKREVLETMRTAYPELWSEDPRGTYRNLGLSAGVFQPFESVQSPEGVFMGEDFSFSKRWTDLGREIWSCFNETVTHTGREVFVGNYSKRIRRQG